MGKTHGVEAGMKLGVWLGISAEAKIPWIPYCLSATADSPSPRAPFPAKLLFTTAEPVHETRYQL